MNDPKDVTYIDATLDRLHEHVRATQRLVKSRVLPGSRYHFTRELEQADTLVAQIKELLERSGMSRRLGFVNADGAVQPVMVGPVNPHDATGAEGSGVPAAG